MKARDALGNLRCSISDVNAVTYPLLTNSQQCAIVKRLYFAFSTRLLIFCSLLLTNSRKSDFKFYLLLMLLAKPHSHLDSSAIHL